MELRNLSRFSLQAKSRELCSKVGRAPTAWDVGIAVRRASRASACSCAASRNSWPTSETHISWIRTSLRSRPRASIPHNGSSSQRSAYGAAVLWYRQAAAAPRRAGKLPRRKGVSKLGGRSVFQRGSPACPILCQLRKKTDSADSSGVPLPGFSQYQKSPLLHQPLTENKGLAPSLPSTVSPV